MMSLMHTQYQCVLLKSSSNDRKVEMQRTDAAREFFEACYVEGEFQDDESIPTNDIVALFLESMSKLIHEGKVCMFTRVSLPSGETYDYYNDILSVPDRINGQTVLLPYVQTMYKRKANS